MDVDMSMGTCIWDPGSHMLVDSTDLQNSAVSVQNFTSRAITPFHVEGIQGGPGFSGTISLVGNTKRMGHRWVIER